MESNSGVHTTAVHAGRGGRCFFGAINEPIYMTSNYGSPLMAHLLI